MDFQMDEALEVLTGTPAVLHSLLGGKSSVWLDCRKSPEAFSPRDVVGHLMHAELTDWIPRVKTILESSDSKAFDPFDRFDFQHLLAGKNMDALLTEFKALRRQSLDTLASLKIDADKLARPGLHPDLGPVTVGNLLSTWVVHDLGHISQIVKAMAGNYREAVGPWRAYCTILG